MIKNLNMDRTLDTYIKVYDNWFEPKQCKQTIKELESVEWSQHTFYNPQQNSATTLSGDKELDVYYGSNSNYKAISTKNYIMQRIWDGYLRYVTDLNFKWFTAWQGHTEVRFNRYLESRVMAEHCDHIHSMFDGERRGIPTMSFVGMLNEDYEGGEFIMFGDKKIELKEGSAIIFPSCFLYPHKVASVTKGVRYSCVSWAW